jgi:hypothetical protein
MFKSSYRAIISVLHEVQTETTTAFPCYLVSLIFDREDGGNMFLRKDGRLSPDYTAIHPT